MKTGEVPILKILSLIDVYCCRIKRYLSIKQAPSEINFPAIIRLTELSMRGARACAERVAAGR